MEFQEDEFAASLICENLPDESVIACGQKFEKYWVFKNEGSVRWNDETRVGDQDTLTGSKFTIIIQL